MTARPVLLALALCLTAVPGPRAESGISGATTLKRPVLARPVGMGEAFSAVDGGLDSLGYNPAGMARLARPELGSSFHHGVTDDNFGFLGYAHPLKFATVAGGAAYYNAGTIDIRHADGREETRTAQQDMVGLVSMGLPLAWGLCAGGTAKFYRLELAEEVRTSGFAADLGALWHTPLKGLNVGASLQNLGSDVKYETDGDPLPTAMRFGAAYDLNLAERRFIKEGGYGIHRFLFTFDGVKPRDRGDLLPAAGLEMGMSLGEQTYGILRFGYLFVQEPAYLTFGVGFRQGRFVFDYALGAMKKDVTSTHHFSFGVRF